MIRSLTIGACCMCCCRTHHGPPPPRPPTTILKIKQTNEVPPRELRGRGEPSAAAAASRPAKEEAAPTQHVASMAAEEAANGKPNFSVAQQPETDAATKYTRKTICDDAKTALPPHPGARSPHLANAVALSLLARRPQWSAKNFSTTGWRGHFLAISAPFLPPRAERTTSSMGI